MDKYDYVENIIVFLRGVTGINYQLQLRNILASYYRYNKKTYEMPDYYGGDQKNDGWVVEDALFYQIFAPTRLKASLKKEIQDKFSEDLGGLLKIICDEKKWGGSLKSFIFIVNTADGNLPHDSERFFDSKVKLFQEQYSINFNFRVVNTEYVREVLNDIVDIKVLEEISASLHIRNLMDYNAITEQQIMNLILSISGNISSIILNPEAGSSYTRISSVDKISVNDLDEKKDEIENIISKLDVVENAINSINLDILSEDKFERVRTFIIEKYLELSKSMSGVPLYEEIVNEVLSFSGDRWNLEVPIKFLIIYIFDKCDIFEKSKKDTLDDTTEQVYYTK